jgi:hypothetical protein
LTGQTATLERLGGHRNVVALNDVPEYPNAPAAPFAVDTNAFAATVYVWIDEEAASLGTTEPATAIFRYAAYKGDTPLTENDVRLHITLTPCHGNVQKQ